MIFYSTRKKFLRWAIGFPFLTLGMRNSILGKMGVTIGKNTGIGKNFFLSDCSTDKGMVIIGDNVDIAANVTITTTSGPWHSKLSNIYPIVTKKVIIEDDVWIGNGVTILPGVTIGKCSIVGAGCVVSKDVPPYSVVSCGNNLCKKLPSALLKLLENK